MPHKFTKLKIYKINSQGLQAPFTCSLNPNSLNRSRKVDWEMLNSPGSAGGLAQFVKVNDQSIKFDIFLASYHAKATKSELEHGLLPQLAYFESLTMPDVDLFLSDNAQFIPPPSVLVVWGSRAFRGELHNISITEQEFDHNLNPVIVKISLDIVTSHVTFSGIVNEVDNLKIEIDKLGL